MLVFKEVRFQWANHGYIRTLAGAPASVLADSLYLLFYTNDKIMHRKSRTIYYQAKIFIGEIDSFYPGSCVFLFQILRLKTLVFYKTEWFKITNLLLSLYGLMIIKVFYASQTILFRFATTSIDSNIMLL